MLWFLAVLLVHNDDRVAASLAQKRYASFASCMKDAIDRTEALASIGIHGRYSCMYHNEPDRELATSQRGEF